MGKTKTAFVGGETEDKNKQKHDKANKADSEKVHIAGLKGGQRVKMVEAVPVETNETPETKEKGAKKIVEKIRSKKYQDAKGKITPGKTYPIAEAVKLVKESSYSKFDGTMELHLIVKKTGTSVQVTLPHSAGREKKIEIASETTIEKLKTGKIDFDILVATADMMPKLVPFARLLGPKGLMPNPKNGTLVTDSKKAESFSAGALILKTEKEAPLIHTVVGKNSQKDEEIAQNTEAILKALGGAKLIAKAYMKSTMSPSVRLQIA